MLSPLVRALRPPQWVKNLFVLAPAVFAHRLLEPAVMLRAGLAFLAFCAASSAVYLLNDLRDREADQQHPLKRLRPLAAGTLSPALASGAALGLAAGALATAVWLGPLFAAVLGIYFALNLAYSWHLKHVVILDVMIVAIGFVLRVEAGAAAIGVGVSSWILLCTIFLALFLAFSKRRHELLLLSHEAAGQRRVLSHYSPKFLDQMINVVTASAVLSYALYATAEESLARHGRGLVYTLPFVLFGVFRYLYLVYQRPGELNPTESLLTDLPFLANLVLWGLAVVGVLYVL
jgi:4-hydroxybenzoate polyprenyltransferase